MFRQFGETPADGKDFETFESFYTTMTEIVLSHVETLDKYTGDGLMSLFGAPTAFKANARSLLTLLNIETARRSALKIPLPSRAPTSGSESRFR